MSRMKLLITDRELPPDAVARAGNASQEVLGRAQCMTRWILGHAIALIDAHDYDSKTIRIKVGSEVIEDKRDEYPSAQLVARIALALDADPNHSATSYDVGDFTTATVGLFAPFNSAAYHITKAELTSQAEHNAFTAAVTAAAEPEGLYDNGKD